MLSQFHSGQCGVLSTDERDSVRSGGFAEVVLMDSSEAAIDNLLVSKL